MAENKKFIVCDFEYMTEVEHMLRWCAGESINCIYPRTEEGD